MHEEVLSPEQKKLFPLLRFMGHRFFLAGGTAVALYLGHRTSIDFDLFTQKSISHISLDRIIAKQGYRIGMVKVQSGDEYTVLISGVKVSFVSYHFSVLPETRWNNIISLPSLLDLAAMKAYAMGRRGKWKDYVDMYFLFREHFSLSEVCERTREIFDGSFNERIFREQLCYFDDVDFSEEVDFIGEDVSEEEIKNFLTKIAIS